ncbi:MAG: hypothetical protein ACREKB_10020, partial [Candidatus Rokuibacteriota bacterium]
DTILARAEEVTAKRTREALLAHAAEARLSRELVTIMRDVPLQLHLATLAPRAVQQERLVQLLTELEFFSLVGKLGAQPRQADRAGETGRAGGMAAPASSGRDSAAPASSAPRVPSGPATALEAGLPAPPDLPVQVVTDPAQIPALVARLRAAPLVALDTETSSPQPRGAQLVGLSLAASPGEVWYLPFGHRGPAGLDLEGAGDRVRNLPALGNAALAPLVALLEDPAVPKAAHHIKYAWQVLRRAGVELQGVVYDTMLAAFLIDSGKRSYGIDVLSLEYLGRPMQRYTGVAGKGKAEVPFAEIPGEAAAKYSGADVATVLSLHEVFAPQLNGTPMARVLAEIELPLTPVLVDMEWEGVKIDLPLLGGL